MSKLKSSKKYFIQTRNTTRVLQQERDLIIKYGLRNKSELAKFVAKLKNYRKTYFNNVNNKFLEEFKQILIDKGILENKSILELTVEDLLKTRLQYRLYSDKLCPSLMSARQKITHGHVYVNGTKIKRPNLIIKNNSHILIKGGDQ